MFRRHHIPLLHIKKPKLLTRQLFDGYDFQKMKTALLTINNANTSNSSPARQFDFQPKFSPALVSENNNKLRITLSESSLFEVEREIKNQLQQSQDDDYNTINHKNKINNSNNWNLQINSDEETPSQSKKNVNWNAFVGTASDFQTKSEVFDHNQESLKHSSSSSGDHSCRSQLPSDATLLSSGKNWLSKALQFGSGVVFQRVESQETEAVVSKQQLSKFTRDQTHATASTGNNANYSVTESNIVAQGLSAARLFDNKLKKQADKFFAEEMELAERSPIFATNREMEQWCLVGDTASHPVNVRRLLLNFFTCYCMKVFGGVPVSGECIAVVNDEDDDKNKNDISSILILGPHRSGKTSLAKHVVARNPEKFFHVGSGVVVIAPVRYGGDDDADGGIGTATNSKNEAVKSSLLRVVPLPIAPTFSDAGILWSALLNHHIANNHNNNVENENNNNNNNDLELMKNWANDELRHLPSDWKRRLASMIDSNGTDGSIPKNSFFSCANMNKISSQSLPFSDFALKGIVTLNWDLNSFGDFEVESSKLFASATAPSSSSSSPESFEKLKVAQKIVGEKHYPCYVRDMNDEEVAKSLAFASCPPYLSKKLYFNEHRRLSDQLFEWGMNNGLSVDDGTFHATEINGSVRFDLAKKHVAQVLEKLN